MCEFDSVGRQSFPIRLPLLRFRKVLAWAWMLVGLLGAAMLARADLAGNCAPVPAGLIGWWTGNGDAKDTTTLHDGVLNSGVTYTPGRFGQAFSLDGTSGFVDLGRWCPGSTWTLEAWANATATNSARRTIVGGANDARDWAIVNQDGQWALAIRPQSSATTATVYSGQPIATGAWYHVVGTCDGTTAKLYVNGQLQASAPVDPYYYGTTSGTRIGGESCCPGNNFAGLVDEVAIYSRALSDAEIQTLAANPKCSLPAAAVPYFTDFENGIGSEWGVPVRNTAETASFTSFSGQFGNNFQFLTLTNLVLGQSYTLGFDFYVLDSWDGGTGGSGDFFNLAINGTQVFHETFGNNNGNVQTFAGSPDEGRANFGFNPSYPDAIYRNLEITFIATNPAATIVFSGQNLEDISNESWGIDNVSVRPSAELTNTFVRSTTLPANGTTNSLSLEFFTISANWPLASATATNPANYAFRAAGPDNLFGTADDVVYALNISLPGTGGRSVAFAPASLPLPPGHYQFQTSTGLQGTNGMAVPVFARDFYLANPVAGALETAGNDTLGAATPLPMTESPAGSGFFTAFAVGSFSSTSDVDYWRFDAEAGDVLTIRLESESQGVYPHLRLRNTADQDLPSGYVDGDYGGTVQIQNYRISTPGTYYLRVWSSNSRSRYWLRVDQSRGPQMEAEDNSSPSAANPLNLAISPGLYQARVVGALPAADTAGDFFRLGMLNAGNAISVTALYPTGSTLTASQTILTIQAEGNPVVLVTNLAGTLNYTVTTNAVHYIRVASAASLPVSGALRAQYFLNIAVSDGVPPVITATSLPAEGAGTTAIVDRFTLNFSEDLLASSVSNSANCELRGAGPDGAFGTADDTLYTVATTGYSSGLAAGYSIVNGPLQPGNYRFTLGTNLLDRAGNSLAAPFVRNFSVGSLPGYVLENRNNDAGGFGTPLSTAPATNCDGTIGWFANLGTAANPQFIVAGQLNGDTNLDLVTANFGGDNITIFLNNGLGQGSSVPVFQTLTNLYTGDGAVSLALGDFNQDGLTDIAVANYYAGTVSIVLGSTNAAPQSALPTAQFFVATNLPGFSNPYNLAAADLNGDGKIDLAVPNYNNGTVSVLLGNGDGTFLVRSNYSTGSNPETVAVGDLNGDGKPDLVVANYGSATLTILTNTGTGGFQTLTNIPVGPNPRYVAIGDVTGDNVPDLVVVQGGDNSVGILAGIGNGNGVSTGAFQPRRSYFGGSTEVYQCLLQDLNGDHRLDIILPGYGNNQISVLLNSAGAPPASGGYGVFTNLYAYSTGQNPIAVAAGDFNNDGRPDLAFAHYYGNYVSLWTANPASPLSEDPPGSGLRTAQARGVRSNSGDVDYYQFSGNAGDQVILAVDVPGNPPQSQLNFQIQRPDGSTFVSFYSDYRGWGQSGVITLPQDGTYLVRVADAYYDYQGEYRFRLSLARPPLQFETEDNNSLSQADPVTFNRTGNRLQGAYAGGLTYNDPGDYYSLGNLLAGSTVNLTVREPASSGLAEILSIYNAAGSLMTNSAAGATNFAFTVPPGQDGVYYVLVTAGSGGFSASAESALRFSGGSDYADLGSWFNYQAFTLSLWVNPGSSQNQYADILDNNHQGGINWVLQQNSSTLNQYNWGPADGSPGILVNLQPNTWQHLAITRDATNVNRLYLNGTLVGEAAGTGQINYNGAQFLRLGRWGGGGRNWNGMVDDLRIWNRPLTQAEIVAGMGGKLTGSEADLLGYWPFTEGFGTVAADLSPGNHPASLINGPTWAPLGPTNAVAPSLLAQYILSFDVTNPAPPQITGVNLPADGSTSSNIITSFGVTFSEDMDPAFSRLSRNIYRYNNHSYLITDYATSWANAEALALGLGGHLAAITNAAENSWISQTFNGYGDLWIGLNNQAGKETYLWTSGDPYLYSNWSGSEPNNSYGYEWAVKMYGNGNGSWDDINPGTSLRGVIEVASTIDSDGDGLVDSLDPYPKDPLNAFDLRAAGPDGLFDTADDEVYRIYTTGYSSGLYASFAIANGPLQPGYYRFKVTTALQDRFGASLATPYVRYFTVAPVSGFVEENRRSGTTSSTSLSLNQSNQLDGSFAGLAYLGTGRNPYAIAQGYLNSDTNLDLVTANISDNNIRVFLGDGAGSFQAVTNISTDSGPIALALVDFNGDGKADLAVANYYAHTVSIFTNASTSSNSVAFSLAGTYAGFSNPYTLATADFDHDGKLDLVAANYGNGTVRVLFGNGDGTFGNAVNYPVGSGPETVAVGDFNGDGQPDLVVANYNSSSLSVLLGNSDGTFQAAVNYGNANNTRAVTVGDVNGDGRLDLVAASGATLNVFLGNGDGTFQPHVDYNIGCNDVYQLALTDINGDGRLDAVVPSYGNSRLITVLNTSLSPLPSGPAPQASPLFGPYITYSPGGNPISVACGDYNHDGRLDLATANYYGNNILVLLGNNTESLALDPAGSGLRMSRGRGNLADGDDADYWTFSAQTGDRLSIRAENPGNPGSSQLLYRIYYPDGSQWTYFYTDGYGRGQISLTVPVSGTYTVRVEQSNAYTGEYRFAVTLAQAPVALEVEDNSSLGNANAITYALNAGQRTATVLGYIGNADSGGDFYQLGNLAAGTQITLAWARPASSLLAPVLEIYNASSVLVTNSLPGQTNLVYMVGTGNGGAYYAHVTWSYPSRNSSVSNALYFNGGNSYVNVGAWTPGPQWSVQAWVMPVSLPGGRRAIAGALNSCLDWGLVLQDGRFGVVTRPPGGCGISYLAPMGAPAGTWSHLTSVCDGTNAFLYVNGVLMASGPVDLNYTPYGGNTWIGGDSCCGEYFPGFIQEVAIWSRALSPVEVATSVTNSPLTDSQHISSQLSLAGYWPLQPVTGPTVPDLSTNGHDGTLVNNPAWSPLAAANSLPSGILQEYLLSVNLLNTIPPQVLAVSLPAEGDISSNILDRFSITFSEDMAPATVTNSANYELRNAGADDTFGTADDQLYAVLNAPVYSSGTGASYLVPDGPLQPGRYRFTVTTNLTDPVGTLLPAPYVRSFSVASLPGFVLENRPGSSGAVITSLSLNRTNRADGSFRAGAGLDLGSGTERIAAGRLNSDTNVDLVAALWQNGGVAVLLGNGDGSFQVKTNYATGSQAWSLALGRFNADTSLDLAVVNYGAGTVSILTGNGNGTFQTGTNYAVGVRPYHIIVADVNSDGNADLVVPNSGSGTISVLLGNGDGTFQSAVNYRVGNTPVYVAAADVNGDNKPDLLVANYDDNNVSLLFGNGDGTFAAPVGLAAGMQPRALTLADLNQDGKLDLAVFNGGDNTISVMLGNGDGSFLPRVNYGTGTSDGYEILATDLNADGWPDLVVAGYNNSSINLLLNYGDGTFLSPSVYSFGNRPVGLVAADFNNDGRLDLAVGNDYGHSVSVLLGNDTQPLTLDVATGLRISAGRGNLANNSQADYWSFDAATGDLVSVACEIPGNPSGSGLHFILYRPDGSQWTDFYGDYYGRGQGGGTIPVSGTYTLRVEPNYNYNGEYRFRVTLTQAPTQLEWENNDSIGNANGLNLPLLSGHRQASVLGYLSSADGSDFFRLGTLSGGATIKLGLAQPKSSGLLADLVLYNGAGSIVAYSPAGATNLTYTLPAGMAQSYYAQVWDAGPTAALRLGGQEGYALRFNGGSDWIAFTNGVIPSAGDFTVECWAYANYSSSYREILSQGTGGNAFYLGTDGNNVRAGDGWGNTGVAFPFYGWHHFAVVKSSTNTLLFIDGVLAGNRGGTIPNPVAADGLRIGRQYGGYGEYWPGSIDEVRIWNLARSAADIQAQMTQRLTGSETGLVGYWRFDDGAGTSVADATAMGNWGTFQNYPVWLPSSRTNVQGSGIFSQYVLKVDLQDAVPAAITSVTLPAGGTTNAGMLDRFTVNFSKDVDPGPLNALNRDIRLYNGHAYTITDSSTWWYNAEQQARALGGHLVTINDAAENAWVYSNFNAYGNLWIGLNDEAQKGNYLWSSGEAVAYINWDNGQPYNANNQDYALMRSGGRWADYSLNSNNRGVIEVAGPDSDGDGIPDTLDPYPADPYNGFDLRAAGPDGLFDTLDDQVYHFTHANYAGGLSLDFSISDGPLQPGYYRFLVSGAVRDLFGNPMSAPFVQYFSVGDVLGYVLENRNNGSAATATPLPLVEDPPGVKSVAARGNLFNNSDYDYWSFSGTAGDLFTLATYIPGSPSGSQLYYRVFKPDGSQLFDYYPSYYGDGQSGVYTLPVTGTYTVLVTYNYSYQGEYRFRITTVTSPLQAETEANDSIGSATALSFGASTNGQSASILGRIRTTSDLDYINLGTISNGYSIFLNVRLPGSSALSPIVSVYNAANGYQAESTGGRANDGVANVPITTTGTYYALVRSGNGSGGLNEQYLLDVNVVPTGSINFPNLIVAGVNPPSGSGILSGQNIAYSFDVANIGNAATAVPNWMDRAVLSTDSILGNGDDIPLGFFPHNGLLNVGDSYSVSNTFTLPDGLSGDYYVIVQTDAGSAVNEFLFKGDNITVSSNAFHVDVAPYPDVVVENLNVSGPDSNNAFNITWNTANRGNALAPAGFYERLLVRNQTASTFLVNSEQAITNSLAPNAVLPHSWTLVTTNPGVYQVQVVTDTRNTLFEYSPSGHDVAEANNSASTNFQIVAYFNATVQSVPPGAGVLSGGGTYALGTAVTATALPNTNTLPYQFVNWTEGGTFQSAASNYTFILTRDRTLTANFTLPTFLSAASNNPPAGGTVSGQGNFFYGTTNVLTANANFGYRFTNWTENGSVIGLIPTLTNIVTSNRFVVANYVEANTLHVVTTGTTPTNVATVNGAGTYTNGQVAAIGAPLSVTNPPNIYNFRQFQLNGALAGTSASFNKTFSTLDPTNLQFIAVYDTVSILPLITNVVVNYPNLVPATTNFVVSFQFNRSMNTNVTPLVGLTNAAATVQPVVRAGGVWTSTATANDTFTPPAITFGAGMDGTNRVWVSQAQDLGGGQLVLTNVLSLVVDVTPPANPVVSLTASNNSWATISWSGYSAPADLNSFRVYLSTNSFSSVAGLTAVSSVSAASRSFTYYGLGLDQPYYAAVVAVDTAGNSTPVVTPLAFSLPSTVPPAVPVQVAAAGPASAVVSWNGYDTSALLGFAGFQLYYETTNFSSATGHAVRQSFGTGTRSVQIDNLDRARTYYFAVVGINGKNAFNPNVTTATWSDPYAGNIAANTTIGRAGQGTVDILQSLTVVNNAVLTIAPGTTVRFAPGTGLTVQQGALVANGTALDPIVFTSANDSSALASPASPPAPGDWNGITLGSGAGASVLRNVFIKYGTGLSLSNCAPTVEAFTALFNAPAGLTLNGTANLNTTNALLAFNGVGAQQLGTAQLSIVNSVLKNNDTNALAYGGLSLRASQNWWGTATAADIDATLKGAVDRSGFLTGEPLLTPAIGTVSNVTQVGSQSVNLRLACRTADSMRLSEDSTFSTVFFAPFTNQAAFGLSSGGGQKTVFAQFRSLTGQTSAPVALTITYITTGPTIAGFNLSEGMVLARPLQVTGSASAPLGMAAMELYVDGLGQATNAGGNFSAWLDVRNFSSGVHRVKLLARDASGNLATRELNVVMAQTPPPAPTLTSPATDLVVNSNSVWVAGTAEPFIEVRLFRSGSLVGTTNATANGTFNFASVLLLEGANQFTALAIDTLGSAGSLIRNVTLDTMPPAQLVMDSPTYRPGTGLGLSWRFPSTGKRATTFQVFWSTVPISSVSQASGSTLLLNGTSTSVQGLATTNYYFYVVGYDALGNSSPLSAPVQFAYDAVPPAFSIAFSKPSPVGVGALHLILSASEPLNGMPTMTVQPYGNAPALLTLSNTALNTYEADINVTTLLPSGPVQLNVSAADLAGNPFNGAPAGPALVFDLTPPAGVITTAPLPPVQTVNATNVAVSLQLTEAPQTGTTPTLSFEPPLGSTVPITLSGAGTNWNGVFTLTPAMGSGVGHFTFSVSDSLGNVGHSLIRGSALEIYNTTLPSAPAQPVGFQVSSLSGGRVQLNWQPVVNAEIYRVYCETGTTFTVPAVLVADNITSNSYVDLPAADGYYRYAVTASRRGSEGTNSIVRIALSDRTAPSAPTNVVVQLAASGLQITWQPGSGSAPDHYNIYRNGGLIRTVSTVAPVLDNPPRGIMTYTVAAADALGNEALSDPVTFQLLVGAVGNLQALVTLGQAPVLSWTSSDSTAVGFNIYRNGIKQNASPLAATNAYTDPLPLGLEAVTYAVTAVNATNAESAARSVNVYALDLGLLVNAVDGATANPPTTSYFDDYKVGVSNLTAGSAFPLQQVEIQRTIEGSAPWNAVASANSSVGIGNFYATEMAVPCSTNTTAQSVRVRAVQQTDVAGSSVVYQKTFGLPAVQTPGLMLELSANQLPLAGGLTPFNVRLYNRGYTPMYFVATRGNGSLPGDVYISVKNPQGQEVSRTPFSGTPVGVLFNGDVGYVMVPAGGSTSFTVPGVLVPEALASNTVTFQAVVSTIYDRVSSSGQLASGPLSGSMQSTLAQTPYFGTAQTDFLLYSNNQPVLITGQALDRATGLPVTTNVPLQIGFAVRGHRWYSSVTTDTNGNYSYTFNVTPGLAGDISIWAAHPDVADQLNQAQISVYRTYITPQAGDIRMSKNDTLPFNITLLNPGDRPLTGFNIGFQAYQMQGTNQLPITTLHGTCLSATNFSVAPGQRQNVTLQLAADLDAPSNAVVVFTLASAEGAAATFTGYVTLLPAVPVLSVVQPDMGYVEVSLNRGSLLSRQVTIANNGLKDLQGVSILPPTNVTWMSLNLPRASDGSIPLPDLAVGQSNSFTVVFAPPTNTDLGFFQDSLIIQGTNAQANFKVNLYARVTSANQGAVQFYVDDILGLDVPNASVRLRNTALQAELPAVQTDINGLVTVTNLQEGDWSWQISAAGHSANVGVVTVIPDQTVNISTRLSKSVVTINFSVVPVPFTDRYEIQLEQTFETHVPLPVLVLTPSYRQFENVTPGFQASYIVTAKNEGLIQMENLTITGQQTGTASYTPLITYLPVLLPQQTVEIPFTVTYWGSNAPARQDLGGALGKCAMDALPNPGGVGEGIPEFIDGLRALANAEGRCIKDNTALALAGAVAVGMKLYQDISGLFTGVAERIAGFIGCVIGTLLADSLGSGPVGPGGSSMQDFQPVGAGCFAAETRVLLVDDRFKTIDQVRPGDVIKSGAGLQEIATVSDIYCLQSESCREISFARPSQAEPDSIQTTDEHLFWVDGRGWVAAGQLRVGEWLLNPNGQRVQVTATQRLPGRRQVYTFKLHGDVAFYANGILVHDLCGPTPAGGNPKSEIRNPKQIPIEKEDHESTRLDTKPGGRNAAYSVGANFSN